jgi:hypothetical protein
MRARVEDADTDGEDEGFVEGPDMQSKGKGKQCDHITFLQDPTQWRRDGDQTGILCNQFYSSFTANIHLALTCNFMHILSTIIILYIHVLDKYTYYYPSVLFSKSLSSNLLSHRS